MNYYNEFDLKAAAWLRELIKTGRIPEGDVDTRSITEVKPDELKHYTQCHFFAGIGGWSLALRLAGWPDDEPVWTGSCPCQPFSSAGKQLGTADERHLWPVFAKLIRECRPPVVFGEQVASKAGRGWLSGVFADLEGMAYRRAGADLCAASVGAPHIRQRLYWLADAGGCACGSGAQGGERPERGCGAGDGWQRVVFSGDTDEDGNCPVCGIDYAECGCPGPTQDDLYEYDERDGVLYARRLDHAEHARLEGHAGNGDDGNQPGRDGANSAGHAATGCESLRLADAPRGQREQRIRPQGNVIQRFADDGADGRMGHTAGRGCGILRDEAQAGSSGYALGSSWARFEIVHCRDGKARRFEPGSFPLAHGVPGRVGLLRGYGNAIVPQVAAEFIQAFTAAFDAGPKGGEV